MDGNKTLTANFEENDTPQPTMYTLTIAATAGGTVSPSVGEHTYEAGASVIVTATADSGYTFENWSGASTSTSASVTVTMDGDKTLTANFGQQSYCEANPTALECSSGATFTDSRDGKTYKRVAIGNQVWMAENLNYEADGSKCGNEASGRLTENSEDCNKYGRLYNWATAMNGASSSSLSPSGVQGVCPAGWHVPSYAEWTALTDFVGGASTAGTKLKSSTGWNSYSGVPVGTDQYGFTALPGGFGSPEGYFLDAGNYGSWWSATEIAANYASYRYMYYYDENVDWRNSSRTNLFSVRCVADE
jgi:uncharacterized protein (TIGR02145 family)/uncharacterized repeat protein (TIGR02543 family)